MSLAWNLVTTACRRLSPLETFFHLTSLLLFCICFSAHGQQLVEGSVPKGPIAPKTPLKIERRARYNSARKFDKTTADTSIVYRIAAPDTLTALYGWVETTANCTFISSGSWVVNSAPAHGVTSSEIVTTTLWSEDPCSGGVYPFATLLYTWTSTDPNITTDSLSATWSTPDGTSESQTFDITLGGLDIVSPAPNSNFQLMEGNDNETDIIPFIAESYDPTTAIAWNLNLSYQTSGGKGATSQTYTFNTYSDQIWDAQYTSTGGQLTATVTQGILSDKLTAVVTGWPIPATMITPALDAAYASGATPNLLTGIAFVESSYLQFNPTKTLYGVTGYWPQESDDGGSHIGLMQVPVTTIDAWDWSQNVIDGAAVFYSKLSSAGRITKRIIAQTPGLPLLTPVQLENMALILYGPFPSADPNKQYYIPDTSGPSPVWIVNTANNPQGVAYADKCRANVR